MDYTYQYEFTPADGGTKMHMISELHLKGFWKLLKPVINSSTKKVTVEEFNNLKADSRGKVNLICDNLGPYVVIIKCSPQITQIDTDLFS